MIYVAIGSDPLRQLTIENQEIDRIRTNSEDEKRIILEVRDSKIQKILLGLTA